MFFRLPKPTLPWLYEVNIFVAAKRFLTNEGQLRLLLLLPLCFPVTFKASRNETKMDLEKSANLDMRLSQKGKLLGRKLFPFAKVQKFFLR